MIGNKLFIIGYALFLILTYAAIGACVGIVLAILKYVITGDKSLWIVLALALAGAGFFPGVLVQSYLRAWFRHFTRKD